MQFNQFLEQKSGLGGLPLARAQRHKPVSLEFAELKVNSIFTVLLKTGAEHYFLLVEEGGGGNRGTPPPELIALWVDEPSRLVPLVDDLLVFPGIDIENVWPSFKE
jgi:hypothetical protein